jgi:hypothetical protein
VDPVKVTHKAEASGSGPLTPVMLRKVLEAMPDDAALNIRTGDSQREGLYWSVTATW